MEEDPAPAYDAEAGPPTYFVPAGIRRETNNGARSEEDKSDENAVACRPATTAGAAQREGEGQGQGERH